MSADWSELARQLSEYAETPKGFEELAGKVTTAYEKELAVRIVRQMFQPHEPLVLSTEADILRRPSPEWLIHGLIQENTIALLAGPGGLGKSFLALGMARSIAAGRMFFNRSVKKGRVLYVAAEGVSAFGDRVRAWNEANPGITVPADGITYVESGVNLQDEGSVQRLAEIVAEGEYALVILDTLSQLGHMENENNNAEVAQVFRQVKKLRDVRQGTSILVIDHTPAQGGKVRGATAKRDNADTVIIAIPHEPDAPFTLSTRLEDGGKQKDGVMEEWHGFTLQPVGKSAVIMNDGNNRRPESPLRKQALEVMSDGAEWSGTDLRAALGIKGDSRSPEGKRLLLQLGHAERDGFLTKKGSTRNVRYQVTETYTALQKLQGECK
ncbi:AAA family ATPase [Microbacterium sp. 22195]|uniref:AAA family ATPase n=1 Tax=Microbacterium sp. 22195 TaxID=3453891 RepID=UPI003F860908